MRGGLLKRLAFLFPFLRQQEGKPSPATPRTLHHLLQQWRYGRFGRLSLPCQPAGGCVFSSGGRVLADFAATLVRVVAERARRAGPELSGPQQRRLRHRRGQVNDGGQMGRLTRGRLWVVEAF